MHYGFIDLYGGQWKDCFVDRYNTMTDEINQKEAAGFDVEDLKNARHSFFVSVAQVYLKEREKEKFKDIETGEIITRSALLVEYERLRDKGLTESENFAEYIENCLTRHNGTLERV